MKKLIFFAIVFILVSFFAAALPRAAETAEQLYDKGEHQKTKDLLLKAVKNESSKENQFELYWRTARAVMEIGNEEEEKGLGKDALISIFQEGVSYAEKAIASSPSRPEGYFWKSANLGRWGETKGVLESLNMAKEMRELLITCVHMDPEYSVAWHVLGILHERVPGGISFGDKDFSVSLARKAIDVNESSVKKGREEEINYGYYVELAKHLDNRNNKAAKRLKNQKKMQDPYKKNSDIFEKNCYYEASVNLKKKDDRNEAEEILTWVISELKSIRNPTFSHISDLKDAEEALQEMQ